MIRRGSLLGTSSSLLFLLLFSLESTYSFGKDTHVESYKIQLEVYPERQSLRARVDLVLELGSLSKDLVTFYLHKELEIDSIRLGGSDMEFNFLANEKSPHFYMPDARPVVVRLPSESKRIKLEFLYQGPIKDLSWQTNTISKSWIELGNYSAWFPNNPDYGKFTYDLDLKIDALYRVTGMGKIRRDGGSWVISQALPVTDIVLAASTELETLSKRAVGDALRLDYISLRPRRAESLYESAVFILQTYNKWFTQIPGSAMTIVSSPRTGGGSYARTGYVSLQREAPGAEERIFRLLGHEIGHLWWSGAPVDNWEDWLNESFAEYSSLMAIRERYGSDHFMDWIDHKKIQDQELPPIIGLNRKDRRAYQVLYSKGPLLLFKLEERLGRDQFCRFLVRLLESEPRSTDTLLQLLEEMAGTTTQNWFGELLTE